MIKSVGQSISAAIEANRLREGGKTGASGSAAALSSSAVSVPSASSPAVRMAALGAPVDADRIAAIKAAIASGQYPVDPSVIADRMMALDLPVAG